MNYNEIMLNNTWILGKCIGMGAFGYIYLGLNIHTNEFVAVKIEDLRVSNLLMGESRITKSMSQAGFPKYHWSGYESNNSPNYTLIMELLGPSIHDQFCLCGNKFSQKTTLMIADQILNRIQTFHQKNFLHRDIKPDNFAMV